MSRYVRQTQIYRSGQVAHSLAIGFLRREPENLRLSTVRAGFSPSLTG
jgi:hypothetical protein